jgi:hypothetical protein
MSWADRRADRINGLLDRFIGPVAHVAASSNVNRPRPIIGYLAARGGESQPRMVLRILGAWRQERIHFVEEWTDLGLVRPVAGTAIGAGVGTAVSNAIKPMFKPS